MVHVWKLQKAKNKLGEVIDQAEQAPQIITRRGVETVVVLSFTEYRKLFLRQKTLSEFLRESPLAEGDLDLTRDRGLVRGGESTP